jgi:predicted amidohydrolase
MKSNWPVLAVAQTASLRGNISANVETHIKFAKAAAAKGADMVVFPELSLTGYEPDIAAANTLTPRDLRIAPLRSVAEESNIVIVAGAPYLSERGLHIAAFVLQPGEVCVYTKHHLHYGEQAFFSPGTMGLQIGLGSERVAFAICADTIHPEHAEAAARVGATVYAAGVFITPRGIESDSAQLRGYAKIHRMVVLMANYAAPSGGYPSAGRSAVWDRHGDTVIQVPGIGEALLITHRESGSLRGELVRP